MADCRLTSARCSPARSADAVGDAPAGPCVRSPPAPPNPQSPIRNRKGGLDRCTYMCYCIGGGSNSILPSRSPWAVGGGPGALSCLRPRPTAASGGRSPVRRALTSKATGANKQRPEHIGPGLIPRDWMLVRSAYCSGRGKRASIAARTRRAASTIARSASAPGSGNSPRYRADTA